jgi:hypothetical protein
MILIEQMAALGRLEPIIPCPTNGRNRRIGDSRRADRDGPLTDQKRKFKSVVRLSDLGPDDFVLASRLWYLACAAWASYRSFPSTDRSRHVGIIWRDLAFADDPLHTARFGLDVVLRTAAFYGK